MNDVVHSTPLQVSCHLYATISCDVFHLRPSWMFFDNLFVFPGTLNLTFLTSATTSNSISMFYLDSSLPISQMMVLADDDRPLEIQSRQPSGEAK